MPLRSLLKSAYSHIPGKKGIFSVVRSVWRPPHHIYQHLHFKGRFRVPVAGSSFLIQHYGYEVENALFWDKKGWEASSRGIWADLCKRAAVIVDIGANTGVYALIAQTVNPSAKVLAFEPVARVFSKLKRNCELNGYPIVCVEKAVSDKTGKAVFYDEPTEHTYSVTVNKNLGKSTAHEVPVETIRLDDFFAKEPGGLAPDLLKIDVETHEPEVLAGMGHLLEKRPTILIEILTREIGEAVEKLLAPYDYEFFYMKEQETIPVERLLADFEPGSYDYNYLAVPRRITRAPA